MNRVWLTLTAVHLALSLFGRTTTATTVLEGSHTRITFSPDTGGIIGIVNTETGHDFISTQVTNPGLWRLVLRKSNGESAELASPGSSKPYFLGPFSDLDSAKRARHSNDDDGL